MIVDNDSSSRYFTIIRFLLYIDLLSYDSIKKHYLNFFLVFTGIYVRYVTLRFIFFLLVLMRVILKLKLTYFETLPQRKTSCR